MSTVTPVGNIYFAVQYWDALKICMEQHVPMTEALVEKLTPSKDMAQSQTDEKNKILEGIAEVSREGAREREAEHDVTS